MRSNGHSSDLTIDSILSNTNNIKTRLCEHDNMMIRPKFSDRKQTGCLEEYKSAKSSGTYDKFRDTVRRS